MCEGAKGRKGGTERLAVVGTAQARVNQGWRGQKKDFMRQQKSEETEASCDPDSPGIWVLFSSLLDAFFLLADFLFFVVSVRGTRALVVLIFKFLL